MRSFYAFDPRIFRYQPDFLYLVLDEDGHNSSGGKFYQARKVWLYHDCSYGYKAYTEAETKVFTYVLSKCCSKPCITADAVYCAPDVKIGDKSGYVQFFVFGDVWLCEHFLNGQTVYTEDEARALDVPGYTLSEVPEAGHLKLSNRKRKFKYGRFFR